MSTILGSNNNFPSVLLVEQGSTPATPAAGHQRFFVRSSDGAACMVDDAGNVTVLQPVPGGSDKQLQYNNNGAFGGISNGTAGQVMTSNGAGSAPSFQALGTGATGNVSATSAFASPPSSPASGDLWFPSNSFYMLRYSGSAWVPWGPIYPFTDPALSGLNTWVNQSTGSISSTNGGLTLTGKPVNGSNDSQAYVKTAPATPYTITAAWLFNSYNSGSGAQHGSLVWRESGSGKLISVGIALLTTGPRISVLKWNSPSSASTTYTEGWTQMGTPIWMQISDDGSNRKVSISSNGQNWVEIHSVGRTDFITADQVGIFVTDSTNRAPVMTLLSWKET